MIGEQNNKKMIDMDYESYIAPIFRFVYFKVRNYHDAEDLTQTVFLKAWKNLSRYKEKNQFLSWLYAIARNTVIDYWKKKKEISLDIETMKIVIDGRQDLAQAIEQEEDLDKIMAAVELLTEDQQEIIILKFIEDFSNREISAITKKNEDAVRQLQTRAIKSLKDILDKNL